jgi:uncharacterized protein
MKKFEDSVIKKNDRRAILEAANKIADMFPLKRVVLFGSKARGTDDEFSDIDILFVCSRKLTWREEKVVIDTLFDIGLKYDAIFSPLFASSEEWNDGMFDSFPIGREILREGAEII